MATISITEEQLFTALRGFITSLVDSAVPVIQGLQNRASTPAGDFIAMTGIGAQQLATTTQEYDRIASTQINQQSKQWMAQIDCYGISAGDNAAMLSEMVRTPFAAAAFADGGLGIAPLYASDPRQLPFVTGEDEYQERWTFEISLQYNPQVTVPQEFADELAVGLINVDAEFPPGV